LSESWARHHPGWEHRLWRADDLAELGVPAEILVRSHKPVELADVALFHILARHGGVCVDADFECLRPLDQLLKGLEAFAAFEMPGVVATGLLGATADHPLFRRATELVSSTLRLTPRPSTPGSPFFTHLLSDFPDVTLFPPYLFYPYPGSELERRGERFDRAYAVQHRA
jgi:inositol phosphorylceramide mannosyltransferase catalytic subunit